MKPHTAFGRSVLASLFLSSLSVFAAPVITAPADYATVSTMTETLKAFKSTSAMTTASTYGSSTKTNATRNAYRDEYRANSVPVTLSWSGANGSATVTVRRAYDSKVVLTTNTTESTVLFYDAEIGRNYTWTVQDSAGTATGHFFTERNAPRIIKYDHGAYVENARDLGGWSAMNGKVVKQGMLYRSRQFEWCAISEPGDSLCIPYYRDVLGIKLDDDLRVYDSGSGIRGCIEEYGGSPYTSPISDHVKRFCTDYVCGISFSDGTGMITTKDYRKAFYHTFTNYVDSSNYPILFHCAHGKDRTGALAFILNGVLGVSSADLNRDYCFSWYAKSDWTLSSLATTSLKSTLNTRYSGSVGSVLADQCAAYITECYTDCGRTAADAAADIATYRALMLEDPETAATAPEPPAEKTWNILMIGNSFSRQIMNSSYPFGVSSRLLGKKVNVYNLYYPGCTLKNHWDNHTKAGYYQEIGYDLESENQFRTYDSTALAAASLDNMLELMDWDIVTIQQGSASSPTLSTYEPSLGNIVNLIHTKAPNAQIKFHQTWSYDRESSKLANNAFGGDVAKREWMYDQLTSHICSFSNTYNYTVIPVGLAAQLYRYQLPVRTFEQDPCYSDHQHFGSDFKYMQLLVWLQYFWGEMPAKSQMVTVPSNSTKEALMRSVALQAVNSTDLTKYGQGTVDWSYTVTFKAADSSTIEAQSVTNGACAVPPDPGTRDGMVFAGWKVNTTTYSAETIAAKKVFNSISYTAAWEDLPIVEDDGRTLVTNDMATADWGFTVYGLGDASNEVAYVYTNTAATMSWTVPDGVSSVRYLLVAGGGAGGKASTGTACAGGGGGAGGLLQGTLPVEAGWTIDFTVGAGGVNANGGNTIVKKGGETLVTAIGGGKGGDGNGAVGNSGGSGGGSGWKQGTGGAGTSGQGCAGGGCSSENGTGGGGGGGGAGTDGTYNSGTAGAAGGNGLVSTITGKSIYYAGGGGGGGRNSGGANGGKGGGGKGGLGNGTSGVTATCGANGVNGLGGGGGGSGRGYSTSGGKGGSGIVIIRFVEQSAGPVHTHVWGTWTTNTVPTCTAAGERTHYCVADGCTEPVASETQPVAALGHDFGDWYTFKAAEVGVAGEKRRECSRCDYFESEEIPALPDPQGGDPESFGTNAMANASWGYEIHGLGAANNEVALVFTNTTETMNWTLPQGVSSVRYLVVGGGGSGGASVALDWYWKTETQKNTNRYYANGGGGAGGFLYNANYAIPSRNLTVSVGAGGAPVSATGEVNENNAFDGNNGGNSVLTFGESAITAHGGGGGGCIGKGKKGGSGGGSGTSYSGYGTPAYGGGECYEGEGNVGGSSARDVAAAGGGGAGGAAPNKTSGAAGGRGGHGVTNDITGVWAWYSAGGGGGVYGNNTSTSGGAGGNGGGGAGGKFSTSNSTAGSGRNYGCGGGGTAGYHALVTRTSGAGKQGVVIVRYVRGGAAPADPIPAEIDTAKSGDVIHTPDGATVSVSTDGKTLSVNSKSYDAKAHYVFDTANGIRLVIDPAEAVIESLEEKSGDASTMQFGIVQTVSGFYYRIKYADNLGFTGAQYTGYTDGDGTTKPLEAPKSGSRRYFRLVVEDVKE